MCNSLPQPYRVRKHINMIVAQADEGHTIEEIALDLRIPRATVLIYLHLADFGCPDSATTANRLLREATK